MPVQLNWRDPEDTAYGEVNSYHPLPVRVLTGQEQNRGRDYSGTIATGATAQNQVPENTQRQYLFIQNLDLTVALWINFGMPATQGAGSIKLTAGSSYELKPPSWVTPEAISLVGPNTGQAFTVKEA